MKRHIILAGIFLVVLGGCNRSEDNGVAGARGFIAVVGAGEGDEMWPVLRGTAASHWAKLPKSGFELRVEAPPIVSVNAQAQLVRRLHREGMRGLCIHVIDPPATRHLLESLRSKGLQIVTMVRSVEAAVPFDHCGWSEQDVGIRMVEALTEALPHGGEVVLLAPADDPDSVIHKQDTSALMQRHQILRHRLAAYPTFKVLGEYPCSSAKAARANIVKSVRLFPALTALVSVGNWPLIEPEDGAGSLIDILGSLKDVIVVTADPFPTTWRTFESGVGIIAVAAEYGSVAPSAIDIVLASLARGSAMRAGGRIPLRVVDEAGFGSFRDEWNSWTSLSPSAPGP